MTVLSTRGSDTDNEHTRPSPQTRETERDDAQVQSGPDQAPTSEEERAAERAGRPDPSVEENYEEALERGANQKGEGRIP